MEALSKGGTQALFTPPTPTQRIVRKAAEIMLGRLAIGRACGRLPLFPGFYSGRVLARRDHTGLHSGLYRSYAEALAAIPASRLAGWDHEESSTLWVDQIDPVKLSTYPVFFWLQMLYRAGSALVDVGGSIGLTYYGYRRYAGLPDAATWTVVEVAKICAQGARIAQREHAAGLRFVTGMAAIRDCDILLSAGALQFMEHSVPGLLETLPYKPRYVLLNKLPISAQADAWTLQNYGPAVTPQRLFNEREFLDYFANHGYRLRDRWVVEDLDCLIPFHPERFIKHFSGFLFELAT